MWSEKPIKNWEQFEKEIANKRYREWIFRGHSDLKWNLESSYYRLFIDMQKIIIAAKGKGKSFAKDMHEKELLRQFKSIAHLFINTLPKERDDLEWLSIMQHYGAPTRFLDMTFSPYVAAFFALENGHDDCCIYALNHKYFTKFDEKRFNGREYQKKVFQSHQKGTKSFFFPYEPKMKNERAFSQQGLFLVSSTNYETYDDIFAVYPKASFACVKYIISKGMRLEGLKKLRLMNISSATLFPGIDGFARSLKFQVLYSIKTIMKL